MTREVSILIVEQREADARGSGSLRLRCFSCEWCSNISVTFPNQSSLPPHAVIGRRQEDCAKQLSGCLHFTALLSQDNSASFPEKLSENCKLTGSWTSTVLISGDMWQRGAAETDCNVAESTDAVLLLLYLFIFCFSGHKYLPGGNSFPYLNIKIYKCVCLRTTVKTSWQGKPRLVRLRWFMKLFLHHDPLFPRHLVYTKSFKSFLI